MTELQEKKHITNEKFEENGQDMKERDQDGSSASHPMYISVDFIDPDTVCGIGNFRPQWMQKYATARVYLIFYCIIGVVQGSYFSTLIGTLSTLEKRYSFKSKVSGSIMMVDEITPLFLGAIVGYFGGRMHRPRVMAVGMIMSSFCCFITALPYFLYGSSPHLIVSATKNETALEYCGRTIDHQTCDEDDGNMTLFAVACFFIGSFCKGFGSLSFYAVGLSYLDDNTKKKNTPLYFAIFEALRFFGPTAGFLMSSASLKYFEDPFGDPGFGSDDPRWIGAWWMGFIFQGSVLIIITLPIFLFPKRLPKQKKRALSNTEAFVQENNMQRMLGMVKAVKRLATNRIYMCTIFAEIIAAVGTMGMFMVLPKYMEIQYRLSASGANLFSGPPALVGMQVATLIGGYVMWKWHPTAKQLYIGLATVRIIWATGILALMFATCQHFEMAGTTMTKSGLLEIQNECNMDCLCSTKSFSPMCGPDNKTTYFSPCHAGCPVQSNLNDTVFSNCSCIFNQDGTTGDEDSLVRNGYCESDGCWLQAKIYTIIYPFLSLSGGLLNVAVFLIPIRAVEPHDKSLSMGLFEAFFSTFALIPSPVIYGALSDAACLIWSHNSCGVSGNCWYYDIDKFNYLIHGTSAGLVLVAAACYLVLSRMTSGIRDLYEEEEGD